MIVFGKQLPVGQKMYRESISAHYGCKRVDVKVNYMPFRA
jgi:hypothetical protein